MRSKRCCSILGLSLVLGLGTAGVGRAVLTAQSLDVGVALAKSRLFFTTKRTLAIVSPAPETSNAPAGWYPRSNNSAQERYWNGQQWTDQVRDKPAVSEDLEAPALQAETSPPPPTFEAPQAGTSIPATFPLPDKPDNTATKVTSAISSYSMASAWISAIAGAPVFILIAIIGLVLTVVFAKSSPPIALLVFLVFVVMPAGSIVWTFLGLRKATRVYRRSSVTTEDLSETRVAAPASEPVLQLLIPGIMKAGLVSYGGPMTVQVQHPENALLVTDQGLYFVYVPMPGADNRYTDTEYATSMFNRKGITEAFDALQSQHPLSSIITMDHRNWLVPYAEVASLRLSNFNKTIKIKKTNDEHRTYTIRRGENWDKLTQLLASRGYGS